MNRAVFILPLLVGSATYAQDSPQAPGSSPAPPSLPPVPQETPHATGPLISPATPGINLDAPPEETPGPAPAPLVPPLGPPPQPPEAPVPIDERNAIILDKPAEHVTVDANRNTVVEGNVHLRYQGYDVSADRVTFDDKRRNATFEGHVVINTGQQTIYGDYLSLNVRTREFVSRNGRSVVPPQLVGPELLQPLRLSGKTLTHIGRNIVATDGFLTTCDFPNPHYKIGFRKATIIPNQRIAMRDVIIYHGTAHLLHIRYLSVPISDRTFHYSYLPQIGRTEEEGFFVKTALGYALKETLPGILRVDLMQKKGIGLGFDQAYRFGAAAAGTLVLYSLRDQNRNVNNLSGRLNHQQKIGDWATTIASDFQQNSYQSLSPTSKTQLTTINTTRTAGATSTSASLSLSQSNYGFGANGTTSYTLSQGQRFGTNGNVTLRFNGSEYKTPGIAGAAGTSRKDQTGEVQATSRVGIFDMELDANKNLVGSQGGTNFFSGTQRLPELILNTDTFRLTRGWPKSFPLRITTGFGRFIETLGAGSSKETDRELIGLDAKHDPIRLIGNLSLQLGGTFRQAMYSDNTAQYTLASQSQITQKLGSTSSLNFTYGYLRPYGFAALRTDQTGSLNNAGANLDINGPRVKLSLLTGYDIQRAQSTLPGPKNPWQNLAIQLALRPSGVFQTRFTTAYDINSGRLREVANRSRIRAFGGFALDTGVRFDPQTHKFPEITETLETPLFHGLWNTSIIAGYNGFTHRFEYKNIAITRSWHDYELTATYIDQPFGFRSEKGINFLFRLKAFPIYQQTGIGQFGTALDTGTGEVF